MLRTDRVDMTRCPACADRRTLAEALVLTHPALSGRLGPERAVQVADGVLAGLALLGRPALLPSVSDIDLGLHVRHLSRVGSGLAWRVLATARHANPYPFAHVSLVDRGRLRSAYAGMLAEKIATSAPDVRLPPPTGEACLLCGVGGVVMPAGQVARLGGRGRAQREVWRELTAPSDALGGRPSPDPIVGQACPPCYDALDSVGSVGPSALERALVEHLRASGRTNEAVKVEAAISGGGLVGLVGWAVTEWEPNGEPWGHLRFSP